VRRVLAVAVLVLACSDPTGTNGKIETVDGLLARICELAARCTGIAGDVAACPAELRTELSQSQLHELEGFTSFTKVQQDHVLACIGLAICGRFGGNLSNMSDSDVMDPYRSCLGSA
jgi:hypothetical protein